MQEAPAGEPAQAGGGAEALQALGQGLSEVVSAVSADQGAPEEAKAAFQAALDAFQQGLSLMSGGGEAAPSGPVSMEQGVSGAKPMGPGGPR